jgi:uncharacterized membrane protein (DUF485 family)
MGGFDHGPAEFVREDKEAAARNARYGLWLFALYLALYAAFVLLNAFRPQLMDLTPAAGLNLAVIYGFGLIFAAFALALIYAWLCRGQGSAETPEDAA